MSDLRVFIDFGSTFTKVVAFDLGRELLLGRVQAPSTVDTDVNLGLDRALNELRRTVDVAEADIASAEEALESLKARLADGSLWLDHTKALQLQAEHDEAARRLDEMYESWEELALLVSQDE